MQTFEDFYKDRKLTESSLSRIYKHYKEHDSGTISAFRYATKCGEGEVYSLEANKSRNFLLKSKLLTKGFGVVPIKGVYTENYGSEHAKEVDEESFFVVDINDNGSLKETLISLGKEFDQDSVTYSEKDGDYYIIGTSKYCKDAYPKLGVSVKLGAPIFGNDGVFHSKVKGRPFVFQKAIKSDVETLDKHTPTEIRSISHLSESSIEDFSKNKDIPYNLENIEEETASEDIAQAPSRIGAEGDIVKRIYPLDIDPKTGKRPKRKLYHAHW